MSSEKVGKITSYGYDGEGVCRVDGKVCFIPFALEGEDVKFKVTNEKSKFCNGEIKQILTKSEKRVTPACPYFGKCGGCAYQHTTYENSLEIKRNLLAGHLKKAGYEGEIKVVPSQNPFNYRNKIKVFVRGKTIGFNERGSNKVCEIDKCLIADELINVALEKVKTFINKQNLFEFYSEIVFRQEQDSCLVVFKKASPAEITYQGLYLLLGKNFGIYEEYKNFLSHKVGLKELKTTEFDLNCIFKPKSFHQVNKFVYPKLYQDVLNSTIGKTVVNCYSGAGVLSGILANSFKRVYGIELGDSEHQDAEVLKQNNNLFNLTNLHGDCKDMLGRIDDKIDTIVLDPPRAGVDEKVCRTLNSTDFDRLVYVSCDVATCVRDISRLENVKILSVTLYDMFALTSEYETMIVLEKR